MLRIDKDPCFRTAVAVRLPGEQEESFVARFRVLGLSEQETFDLGSAEGATGFLRRVVIGGEDIAGTDGEPLVWSDELRDRLIDLPHIRSALVRAYFEGVASAREGN